MAARKVYAFVVSSDFVRTSDHDQRYVQRLSRGWSGFMRHVDGAGGFTAEVMLKVDGRDILGRAPKSCLQIGAERQDPCPIEIIDSDAIQPPAPPPTARATDTVLLKALRAIWHSIRQNRQAIESMLPKLSTAAQNVFFGQEAATFADDIYRCLLPGVREVLDGGRPTWEQLMALSRVTGHWPLNERGIYLILYELSQLEQFFTGLFQYAKYIGQTNDFPRRNAEHSRNPGGTTSNHYRVADKARNRRMMPLLFISGRVHDRFIHVAELTLLCLFDSWYPNLFERTNAQLLGSYSHDFEAAAAISAIVRPAIAATGWRLPEMVGLNWQTPVVTGHIEAQQYVSWWEEPAEVVTDPGRHISIHLGEQQHITIPREVFGPQAAGFTGTEAVHLIAEVAMDSREGNYITHPFRFVRLPPQIGRNAELENLRALALRIEWLDRGVWKMAYLTRAKLWHGAKGGEIREKAMTLYTAAMAVWMDIHKISYDNSPQWLPRRRAVEVQRISYDHLAQVLVSAKVPPQPSRVWPPDHSIDDNRQRLRAMFANTPGLYIGVKPPTPMPRTREACDICYTQVGTHKCSFDTTAPTCEFCRELNRPCTFLPNVPKENLQQGGRHEELGIAVNIHRKGFGENAVQTMAAAPFDPRLEEEYREERDVV